MLSHLCIERQGGQGGAKRRVENVAEEQTDRSKERKGGERELTDTIFIIFQTLLSVPYEI